MDLALKVAEIVAPVFALALIGLVWVRMGLDYDTRFVTRLSMTLAVPCLIFMALVRTGIEPAALADTAVASLVAYALVTLMAWALVRGLGLHMPTYLAPIIFGNTGNLGLPVALFAFGGPGLDFAVVIFAIMAVLSFTIGIWMVSGGGSVLAAFREPMVGATLLGGLFLVMGWQVPVWVGNTLELVGQMGIPLMLVTLGVAIARLKPAAVLPALALSVAKLAGCVAAALAAGWLMGLPKLALGVLVLQLSTPVAVTSYMLAEKYKARAEEVAGLVVVSTLVSIGAIPVILAFFV
jgi:predicted permease